MERTAKYRYEISNPNLLSLKRVIKKEKEKEMMQQQPS